MKKPALFVLVVLALTSIGTAAATAQTALSIADKVETDDQPGSKVATGTAPFKVVGAEPPSTLRVGTFDSRFVALAYYRSEHGMNPARALQEELQEAREAKHKKRLRELESKGSALQNLMHQQVFGNLSIPNVLKTVSDSLPAVATNAGVSLLVSKWEIQYSTSEIELVDLTPQLVELFDVDEATRRIIDKSLKAAVDPVPIEQLLNPHD